MSGEAAPALELHDIQSGVLRPRPSPYAATYILFRIDEAKAGRDLMSRLSRVVTAASEPRSPMGDTWVSVALTFQGLKALGVPESSLAGFSWEFQQGMAARAATLKDVGESSPEHWEQPLGTAEVHVVIAVVAPNSEALEAALAPARKSYEGMSGVTAIWRQDCHALPTEKEPFGFRDGINHPAVEGSGIPGTDPNEVPLKAGDFVLGYRDEMGGFAPAPEPDPLGRNGSYMVFRKLHQRVAAFRRYLRDQASEPAEEEWLAAKMMGRWRSGAPLALCPMHDDPQLGADPTRNNDFRYADDDLGYATPLGSHVRRMNPRDTKIAGEARLHRMIRRGAAYGPLLPEGVTEDDGADRGLMFTFIGAHLKRQFEFVQSEWVNDGVFVSLGGARDPMAGVADDGGVFSIPRRPIPKRLKGIPPFVVT
ncbi:MAG: Dyp-type peroxidase, partial [Phenylobacterium sp.]